jgi:hypothetical protein
MNIKKFTQFISENEHYSSINEGDIVPGVPCNTTTSPGPGKLLVNSDKDLTQISISKSAGGNNKNFSLFFFTSNKPLVEGKTKTYALVNAVRDGKTDELAAVTNMTDLTAKKSSQNYQIRANSIDLLVSFMQATGIAEDATLGANLAKAIATLLLDPMYKDKATDTFKKFADNIIMNVNYNGFNSGMSDNFLSVMQSAGMKAFRTQLVKSYNTLSKPKTADATKK